MEVLCGGRVRRVVTVDDPSLRPECTVIHGARVVARGGGSHAENISAR